MTPGCFAERDPDSRRPRPPRESGVVLRAGPRGRRADPAASAGDAVERAAGRDRQQLVAHRGRGAAAEGGVEVATCPRSLPALAPAGRHAAHGGAPSVRSLVDGTLSKAGAHLYIPKK